MEKKCIIPAALMLLVASFHSCSDKKGYGEPGSSGTPSHQLSEKHVKMERSLRLTEAANSPSYDIKINLIYFTPLSDATAEKMNRQILRYAMDTTALTPKDAVQAYVNALYNDYREEMLDFYKEDEKSKDTRSGRNYNYTYHLDTDTDEGYKDVVCYKMESYSYTAGAHGMSMTFYMNFDRDGNMLSLADLFDDGFESQLIPILIQELMEEHHVTTPEELKEKGFIDTSQLYVSDNFKLDDDEIEFVYNEYEIAPYSVGCIKVDVDYKTIKHLLKKEWR